MTAPVDVLAQAAGELRKECSCVVGGPNHGQCLNCDLSDRIEATRAAVAELIEAADSLNVWVEEFLSAVGDDEAGEGKRLLTAHRDAIVRCEGGSS